MFTRDAHGIPRLALLMIALMALMQAACTYQKVVKDGWDDIRDLDKRSHPKLRPEEAINIDPNAAAKDAASEHGWAILLDTYEGGKREHRGRELAARLTRQYGLSDVWTKEVGDEVWVLRGIYGEPDTDNAKTDLAETRRLTVDGERLYEHANLVPLAPAARSGNVTEGDDPAIGNPLDLNRYKGKLTLLIGYYDGPNRRDDAEKAAAAIRDAGDEAFFLHGPRFSLVTVGMFSDEDMPSNVYGPKILAMQKKYPYYLSNGVTMIEYTKDNKKIGEKPSVLMEVE